MRQSSHNTSQKEVFMLTTAVLPISLGILGLVAAFLVYARILQTPAGEGRVREIADEIHLGALSLIHI